ncbi:kinesin-like protein KIFC3 [Scyliorhinus canicula]|uniref:kinesin-like protein KIFC3 n=1 Tax=Scyliorhinus canicula TaxID=7830 RepID=UPI0018F509CB|nr:kinesin-like protein KIFC3 [Scyliorhinus canicula]
MGSGMTKPRAIKPQDTLVTIEDKLASSHCSSENRPCEAVAVKNSNRTDMNCRVQTCERRSPKISEERYNSEEDEKQEEIEQLYQCVHSTAETSVNVHSSENNNPEADGLTVTFENFLHNDGNLYTCITENNIKLYLDEMKEFVPFPEKWHKQGKFINMLHETATSSVNSKDQSNVDVLYFMDDDRAGDLWVPGKGMVMTYIFEEKTNICKYFDVDCGAWLILPLQWEMNLDFIRKRVEQVERGIPSLSDHREVTAALRQCNYDAEEVISIFLAIFGDSLLIPFKSQRDYKEENGYRHLVERDIIIDDLQQKLQCSNTAVENLQEKIKVLLEENSRQSEMIQSLNKKIAELEIDCKEALQRVTVLQKTRSKSSNRNQISPAPSLERKKLQEIYKITCELNISNRQLRSVVNLKMAEISQLIKQLVNPVLKLQSIEARSAQEIEDLRSFCKKEALEKKLLRNKLQELCGNIQVFCRCRQDPAARTVLGFPSDGEISVNQNGNRKVFSFDRVYPPTTSQEQVFEGIRPIIASCADGYNICILAYGQTGSGKTYTMMGNEDNPGVTIRSIRELLRVCQERNNVKYTAKISILEIYNEAIQDLLSKQPNAELEIRSQGKTVVIPGLTEIEVETENDIRRVMQLGNKNRTVSSTKMNCGSSRSHLLQILYVTGVDNASEAIYHGTLTLCDLAGSECIFKTEATGQRLLEAAAVNKSLTALQQVLIALQNNALHVPYRNSKLTYLLQSALSRDAKVCIFLNISPNVRNLDGTWSTLQLGASVGQMSLGKNARHVTSKTSN